MKKEKYFGFSLVLFMLLVSCSKKDLDMTVLNKSYFDGADFTEIDLSNGWNVTIVQDDQQSGVTLEYSAFLEDYLQVTLDGSALSVSHNKKYNMPYNTVMNAVIRVKTLKKLNAKSAVTVNLEGTIENNDIEIQLIDAATCKGGSFNGNASISLANASQLADFTINGNNCDIQITKASTFKGNPTADTLTVTINDGSRMITYGGQVHRLDADLDNVGMLHADNTPMDEAFVTLKSASEATLRVNTLIKGSLKEASTLYYKGNPTIDLDCDITSSYNPL